MSNGDSLKLDFTSSSMYHVIVEKMEITVTKKFKKDILKFGGTM